MSALRSKRVGSTSTMRLRKVHCSSCRYTIRMARSWIEVGLPPCPNPACVSNGEPMQCANPADAIEAGLLTLDELPRALRTEICRANGWEDEIIRTTRGRRSTPRQCKHAGCSTFVAKGELYCAGHTGDSMPF